VTVRAGESSHVDVPAGDYKDRGLMVAGSVLVALAGACGVTGAVLGASMSSRDRDGMGAIAYGPPLGIGGLLLIIGIPMLAVGAPIVSSLPEDEEASVRVKPLFGPTSGGLRVTF
jgi:hypothetical protein